MQMIREKIKKVPKCYWVLVLIFVLGAALRTYKFHDILRFNADQARDAALVSDVVEHKTTWPLLGPKAGGTNFKLGPFFYYEEIISAKFFGNYPDKLAYPDLFFSILSIGLLFLLLRKLFDSKLSLILTSVFAFSAYAVKYAHFAWNPNSTPFWSMLFIYALHEMLIEKKQRKYIWASVLGVSLGIGMQLHTLLLIFLPIMTIGMVIWQLSKKDKNILGYLSVILLLACLLNVGQITNEIKTRGENTKAFFQGVGTKEKKGSGVVSNLFKDVNCSIQGNLYVLSGYNMSDQCELKEVKKGINPWLTILGGIFFFGGLLMACKSWKKESNVDKKKMLGILLAYFLLVFLFLIPLANEISMRFYLISIFMPFVFLGFWIKFIIKKAGKYSNIILIMVAAVFVCLNLFFVKKMINELSAPKSKVFEVVTLKELEETANFIVKHEKGNEVYLNGNAQFLFKAQKGIEYLVGKSGTKILGSNAKNQNNPATFLVEYGNKKNLDFGNNQELVDSKKIGRITIYLLNQKQ